MGNGTPLSRQQQPYKLFLRQHQCPGDVLAMTAAVESLHRKYPGKFLTNILTTAQEIWANNPRVTPLSPVHCEIIDCEYPAVHECGSRHVHFMAAFCEHLGRKLGVELPLLVNRPQLYLGPGEGMLDAVKDVGPYVVVNAGRKSDFTAKGAGSYLWQQVVYHFTNRIQFVQIGEKNPSHHHPPLDGVINMVGKTTTRELFRLVKHATAATGPVTFLHHLSAAFGVPYVCLAGGREDPSWEAYSTTTYLHTMGCLDCCKDKACWKSRTIPLNDGCNNDRSLCALPVVQPDGETIPKCLQMIGHEGVIEALERILRCRS